MLLPGDRRTSPNGEVLNFQADGNLVHYSSGSALFATRTSGLFALMQPDGNFVVYAYAGYDEQAGEEVLVPQFNTGTAGYPGSRLVVQSDRRLVVHTPDNRAVFSSRR